MSHPIQSEAHLTTFEAISMIVGNSIGTGIIAVPYLATKNSMLDVVWMVLIAYCVNVILHLIIAELSYNNGGVQLVKSFEGELFHGTMKQIFSWGVFIVYGLAIMIGVSGNINGGAQIFVNWFGMPFVAAQVLYYVIAGVVVFIGMKAVGIAQKYAVIVLMGIVAVMTVGTFMHPLNSLQRAQFHWNNLLALYSMVVFATSANQAVIQVVKGLDGNAKQIRRSIFIGFGLSSVFVLIVTGTVLLGTKGALEKELAYMQLGESIGTWAMILAGVFSLFALLTTFWSNTLALRDVVHEQIGSGNHQLADRHSSLHPVCGVWCEQLYCSDADYERCSGTGEHHAGVDVRKIQKKGGQQSYLRCDRHGAFSGADGDFNSTFCNRSIDPVELIPKKKRDSYVYFQKLSDPGRRDFFPLHPDGQRL